MSIRGRPLWSTHRPLYSRRTALLDFVKQLARVGKDGTLRMQDDLVRPLDTVSIAPGLVHWLTFRTLIVVPKRECREFLGSRAFAAFSASKSCLSLSLEA